MEAIAVIGLLGLGYLADTKESNISPEEVEQDYREKIPNGNTVYDVDNYNQSKHQEQNELDEHYRQLNDVESNRIGIQDTFTKPQMKALPKDYESKDSYVQSMLSENFLVRMIF